MIQIHILQSDGNHVMMDGFHDRTEAIKHLLLIRSKRFQAWIEEAPTQPTQPSQQSQSILRRYAQPGMAV